MRDLLLAFIPILLSQCQSTDRPVGKLTERENLELFASCGRQRQIDVPFAAISSRHVILDTNMDFLRDKFDRNNCKDGIFEIKTGDIDIMHEKTTTENGTPVRSAWYIGSCEADTPQGFIIVEHVLEPETFGEPLCLPNADLQDGDFLELFTERSKAFQPESSYAEVGFCLNGIDFCAKEYVENFVGPVVNPWDDRRTYAGHAYSDGDHVTQIVSIHQYKQQICTVSGICSISLEPENSSDGLTTLVQPVFHVSDEPELKVTFVSEESSRETPQQFSDSEVVFLDSDNDEASGQLDYDSSEYTDDSAPSSAPTIFKKQISFSSPAFENSAATIVDSAPEPLSAIFIPLPATPAPAKISSELSSPTGLLIVGFLIVAFLFYACMCLNCCCEKDSCGRSLSGANSPV